MTGNCISIESDDMQKMTALKPDMNLSAHPLKSLLMDKGIGGLEALLQENQRGLIAIQQSMAELMDLHGVVKEEHGVNCLHLILNRDVQPGVKQSKPELLTYKEQVGAQYLEWRGASDWANEYGYSTRSGIRVNPFCSNSQHYSQIKEFVLKRNKSYYEALLAIESIRVTLNGGSRMLRKRMTELYSLLDEKNGLKDFEIPTVNRNASRMIKSLLNVQGVETALAALR
jgi:hypothetical protein